MKCRFRLQKFIHGDHQGGGTDAADIIGHYDNVDEPLAKMAELAATIPESQRSWVEYEVVQVIKVEG